MMNHLTYSPFTRAPDGTVKNWEITRAVDSRYLAIVPMENQARVLCDMPEIPDGWLSWPGRKVTAPAGDMNPSNRPMPFCDVLTTARSRVPVNDPRSPHTPPEGDSLLTSLHAAIDALSRLAERLRKESIR